MTDNNDNDSNSNVPSSLLLQFFQEATDSLNKMHEKKKKEEEEEPKGGLNAHRQSLLNVQVEILQRVVEEHNKSNNSIITTEEVQTVLREMGGTSAATTSSSSSTEGNLTEAMTEMNEVARHAFTRLVMLEQLSRGSNSISDDNETEFQNQGDMAVSDVVQFCALCTTAVALPEVQRYLKRGGSLLRKHQEEEEDKDESPSLTFPLLEQRVAHVQNLFYHAVGYTTTHGTNEMRRLLRTPPPPDDDTTTELVLALQRFLSSVNTAMNQAMSSSFTDTSLDDMDQGGCTRVVSVQHSEFDSNTSSIISGSSNKDVMEEHVEQDQLRSLHVARQAASLHQSILGELLSMEQNERTQLLARAQQAHDDFMNQVSKLPVDGPERVLYLRRVSEQTQRLLIMHKLWEQMLKEHDGEPPKDRRSESSV